MNSVHWFHRIKSLPFHTASCTPPPPPPFLRVCTPIHIFCWNNEKIHPRWRFIQLSCFLWQSWMNRRREREILGQFLWHWLGVTDYFRPRQRSLGHEGQRAHWLMKWGRWHWGSSPQTYGYMHTRVDPRPEVASRWLSDGLCFFPDSTERSHGNSDIGVRSPEEEWSCNVIYLQASVNVCSQESTKLR